MTTHLQTVAARSGVASDTPEKQAPMDAFTVWSAAQEEIDRRAGGLRALLDVIRVAADMPEPRHANFEDTTLPELMSLGMRELNRLYGATEALSRAAKDGRHVRFEDLPDDLRPIPIGSDE